MLKFRSECEHELEHGHGQQARTRTWSIMLVSVSVPVSMSVFIFTFMCELYHTYFNANKLLSTLIVARKNKSIIFLSYFFASGQLSAISKSKDGGNQELSALLWTTVILLTKSTKVTF